MISGLKVFNKWSLIDGLTIMRQNYLDLLNLIWAKLKVYFYLFHKYLRRLSNKLLEN